MCSRVLGPGDGLHPPAPRPVWRLEDTGVAEALELIRQNWKVEGTHNHHHILPTTTTTSLLPGSAGGGEGADGDEEQVEVGPWLPWHPRSKVKKEVVVSKILIYFRGWWGEVGVRGVALHSAGEQATLCRNAILTCRCGTCTD